MEAHPPPQTSSSRPEAAHLPPQWRDPVCLPLPLLVLRPEATGCNLVREHPDPLDVGCAYFLLPAFSLLLAAAARLSAFLSADVCFAFGSQLPLLPAFVPATRLNPGQHACPSPELF